MDPMVTEELNASMRELTDTLRDFSGSLSTFSGAVDSSTKSISALDAAEKAANEKIQVAANNFKSAIDNAGTAITSFAKAAMSAEEGFKKYGSALNSAGDAAFDIGKNFGILGIAIGGLLKGIGLFAGEALKMHDTMIQLNREATRFAGVIPGTVRNMADLAANAGYAGEKMLKLVKITESVSTNLVALGGTAGTGVIKFQLLANVGNKVYEQFSKLGVSQESLTKMQADYVRLQGMSGQAYSLQNKSMGQLQKESLAYATNLIKMSAITGEQADDLQKQREAVKAEMEERIKARQEELAAQKADREGRHEDAKQIRADSAARGAILNKMTDMYGAEAASMVGRVLRTGAFDQYSAGLASMGLSVEDLQGQMKTMSRGVAATNDVTRQQQILNQGSLKIADKYNTGLDQFATNLGDAAQFSKDLPALYGVTNDALAKSNLAIGKSASEREALAEKELEAKKNQQDKDAAMRAEQETAERELQKQYQTTMLNLANLIIPSVIDGLNFFREVMDGVVVAVNFVIDAFNYIRPAIELAMDVINQITDFVLWPFLELGGLIATNWETIVAVSKDVTDLVLWPFLKIGEGLVYAWEKVAQIGEWIVDKFKGLGDALGWLVDKVGGWLGIDTSNAGADFVDWMKEKAGQAVDFTHGLAQSAKESNAQSVQNITNNDQVKATVAAVKEIAGPGGVIDRRSQMRADQIGGRVGISGDAVREIGRVAVGSFAGGYGAARLGASAGRVLNLEQAAARGLTAKSAAVGGVIGGAITSREYQPGEVANIPGRAPGTPQKTTTEAVNQTLAQTGSPTTALTVYDKSPKDIAKVADESLDKTKSQTTATSDQTKQTKAVIEQTDKLAKNEREIMTKKMELFKKFTEVMDATTLMVLTFKQAVDDLVKQIGTNMRQLMNNNLGGTADTEATVEGLMALNKEMESAGGTILTPLGMSNTGTIGGVYHMSNDARSTAFQNMNDQERRELQRLGFNSAPTLDQLITGRGRQARFVNDNARQADELLARSYYRYIVGETQKQLGRPGTLLDARLMTHLGPAGFANYTRALEQNPNMSMEDLRRPVREGGIGANVDMRQFHGNTVSGFREEVRNKINEALGGGPEQQRIKQLAARLKGEGYNISGHPDYDPTGGHKDGSLHPAGRALDVNIGTGNTEWNDEKQKSQFDSLATRLRGEGFEVIWGTGDHKDHMHIELAKGGIVSGPSTGFPATLHGTEVVTPLNTDSILMKLAKTPVESPDIDGLLASKNNQESNERLMQLHRELMATLTSKLDDVIDALDDGNTTRVRILRNSMG